MIRSLFLTFIVSGFAAYGQDQDTTDLAELRNLKAETEASELQKKLNENVGAASKKALASRETPGIVSVITEEDISRNGARDMMDVLRLVPGFDFASDVNFVTGLTLRGAWSLEGKILVLLDGMELNDLMYQNVAFFNRFPIDLIHRIEIIRGPGSAVYGGTAEYGVINIITKGAADGYGVTASSLYGALPNSYGRINNQAMAAIKIGKNTRLDFSFFRGQAVKSDQYYTELYGDTALYLTKTTQTNTYHANIGLKVNNLSFRYLWEDYKSASDPYISTEFINHFVTVKNEFKINPNFKLTPFIYYSWQEPWKQKTTADNADYFINQTYRAKGGVFGSYDLSRRINLVTGAEYFMDHANLDTSAFVGKTNINFDLYSFYAQALFKHPFVNITGGFRFDKHNKFGAAFVPRLALTKRFGNFHFKVLASRSYRAPGIANIVLNDTIRPEKSSVMELELGYQLTPDMLLSVNGYQVKTKDIIVYFYKDLGGGNYQDGYNNYSKFGTKGIEISYAFKKARWNAEANYSFYQAGASTVDKFSVPGDTNRFIGIPQTKLTLIAGVNITKDFSFNTTLNHFGKRFAYTHLDVNGDPEVTSLDAYTLLNINLSYKNLFTPGLCLSLGVYDLLNEKPAIPQAYNGYTAPLSGRSREVAVKIVYSIPFTK